MNWQAGFPQKGPNNMRVVPVGSGVARIGVRDGVGKRLEST